MANPKLTVPKSTGDKLLDLLGFGFLAVMLAYSIYNYGRLPEEIPTHFGIDGKPDDYGAKFTVFLIPIIAVVMYVSMWILNRFPHIFNYPSDITETNALGQYTMATKMIRVINVFMAAIFAYITFTIVRTAHGMQNGLSTGFALVLITGLFGILAYSIYKQVKFKD